MTIEWVGSIGGNRGGMYVQDNVAYLGQGNTLHLLDVSNPAQPVRLSGVPLSGVIRDVQVVGSYAYAYTLYYLPEDYLWRLHVVDVSDPTNPTLKGTYSEVFHSDARAAPHVVGNYAYITYYDYNPAGGLRIVDVSDPTNPTLVGNLDLEGVDGTSNVRVVDEIAYIQGGYDYDVQTSQLHEVDVSDPTNPTLVQTRELAQGEAFVVGDFFYNGYSFEQVVENYTYGVRSEPISDSSDSYRLELSIEDVSNPTAPVEVGSLELSLGGWEMADRGGLVYVDGNYAYILGYYEGLKIVDVSNPAAPTLAGSFDDFVFGDAGRVQVVGDYAYLSSYSDLTVVDISNPLSPTIVGRWMADEGTGFTHDIYVTGNYVYLALKAGLYIVNVQDPTNPTLTGIVENGLEVTSVWVVDNHAYITQTEPSFGLFRVVDVSNPASPSIVGTLEDYHFTQSYQADGRYCDVQVVGNYAYYGGDDFVVVDISDPTAPSLVATDLVNAKNSMYVLGNYAYLGGTSLRVVDISNPADHAEVGSYDVPGYILDIHVSGNYAYVTYSTFHTTDNETVIDGLQVVNISDPTAPTLAANYEITADYVYDVSVSGEYAYVSAGRGGLQILRVSDGSSQPDPDPTTEPTPDPTTEPDPGASPELALNYDTGKPGSTFVLEGTNFGHTSSITPSINGQSVGDVSITEGQFTLGLVTDANAQEGTYTVSIISGTTSLAADDTLLSVQYTLDEAAPLRDEQPEGATLVDVPASVAPANPTPSGDILYIPLVRR